MKAFFSKIFKRTSVQVLLIIVLIILARKAYIKIDNMRITPEGTDVSIEQFNEDFRKIAYNEKLAGHIQIEDPDVSAVWGVSDNFKKVNKEERVLILNLSAFFYKYFFFRIAPNEEAEIKSLVRAFFYMKSHEVPVDIIGIKMVYTWQMAGEAFLYMSMKELEDLYRDVYVEGLPVDEQVDLFADTIVEKSGYERRGREFWLNKSE